LFDFSSSFLDFFKHWERQLPLWDYIPFVLPSPWEKIGRSLFFLFHSQCFCDVRLTCEKDLEDVSSSEDVLPYGNQSRMKIRELKPGEESSEADGAEDCGDLRYNNLYLCGSDIPLTSSL
jgi:hypothetical protein